MGSWLIRDLVVVGNFLPTSEWEVVYSAMHSGRVQHWMCTGITRHGAGKGLILETIKPRLEYFAVA